MNQDPTLQPQDPSAQVAAAELVSQQTPAEMIGVIDGQFDVQRGTGETAYTEKGWSVVEVGVDTDKETGEKRQFVLITNAKLGDDGKPLRDENGELDGDTKDIWTDKLRGWQTTENKDSSEVTEAENALKRVGAPAVHTEVEVAMLPQEVDPIASEQQGEVELSAEFKQRASGDLDALFSELNRFANMRDVDVNDSLRNLIDYGQRQHVDVRRTFDGAAIGALRDPNYANKYYADAVRPSLQELFGADTAALRRIDDIINTHVETMRSGANQDPSRAAELKAQFMSSVVEQSRSIKNKISADNSRAIRQAELFLQGLALGLSDNASRGHAEQLVRRTLIKN